MSDVSKVEEIYLAAVEQPDSNQRAKYLDGVCGDDADLRRRVETLLAAHPHADGFLEPVDPGKTHEYVQPETQAIGTMIANRYSLVEVIGEGGMGTVWRAKQTEPVKRYVALKLIKPGMDSKQVLARFEAERQALAVMDHPNIARILDGGIHDNRPFFVMELVKGTPITEFCDARKLTPQQRLELFMPVCQAIQHAHQKGIIHRDIKPSNVLIALYDDKPVPKVIDFGVAKATGGALTQHTIDTGFGGVVGTPQYMSPEQATFNNLDIDTRSDVYSLGTLLYELLAGSPPFAQPELEKRGLLEILRVVREEEPPRPSLKLSTAEARASISANRGTEPAQLSQLMKGEIDWIVMKALEKDRARRYETANGFAADIQRYLAGEQVQAVPPSFAYRLKKAYRRNRAAVLISTAFTALIVSAAIVGAVLAVQARKAEALAEAKRIEAEEQRAYAEKQQERATKLSTIHLEAMLDAKLRAASSRIDADLLEWKADPRIGLLRLAKPLDTGIGVVNLGEDVDGGTIRMSGSIDENPEFVKLREFQAAAVITAGQEFVPLVPPLETACGDRDPTIWGRKGRDVFQSANDPRLFERFSPDGKMCIAGKEREGLRVIAIPSMKSIAVLREGSERVLRADFSPDGNTVYTEDTDGIVRFWNPDGSLRAKTPLRADRFVYPSGMTLNHVQNIKSYTGRLKVYNGVALIETDYPELEWQLAENNQKVEIKLKEESKPKKGPLELYSTRTGQLIRRLDRHESMLVTYVFDDRFLVLRLQSTIEKNAAFDDTLFILSGDDGRELIQINHRGQSGGISHTLSPSGKWLMTETSRQIEGKEEGFVRCESIHLWDTASWKSVDHLIPLEIMNTFKSGLLRGAQFLTDQVVVVWPIDGEVGFFTLGKPNSWGTFREFDLPTTSWWFDSEIRDNSIVFGSRKQLIDTNSMTRVKPAPGRKFAVELAKFAPDGRFLGSLDTLTEKTLPHGMKEDEYHKYVPGLGQIRFEIGRNFEEYEDRLGGVLYPAVNSPDAEWLNIQPDTKRLDIPPKMLELWAQVIVAGELSADDRFLHWDEPTWAAKQRVLAAMKLPYRDFPFPGWAATEPNLWWRIRAHVSDLESEEYVQLRDEWQRRTGRTRPDLGPDTWRTPGPDSSSEQSQPSTSEGSSVSDAPNTQP
jgi:hypothetical protein